jgi:hypothetical protein
MYTLYMSNKLKSHYLNPFLPKPSKPSDYFDHLDDLVLWFIKYTYIKILNNALIVLLVIPVITPVIYKSLIITIDN